MVTVDELLRVSSPCGRNGNTNWNGYDSFTTTRQPGLRAAQVAPEAVRAGHESCICTSAALAPRAELEARKATLLRERQRLQREVQTHTAQGRITGWILCALPLALLVVINIANPGYSHVLFADGIGRNLLYAGLLLLVIGSVWIHSIVRGIEV